MTHNCIILPLWVNGLILRNIKVCINLIKCLYQSRRNIYQDDLDILIEGETCATDTMFISWFTGKRYNIYLNTLRPRQHGRHFADDSFKRIFLNKNIGILIKISLKFVHKGPISNIQALVQIMALRRPGDKPLSEPMVGSLLTHICVTRPQWVNKWARCSWTCWHASHFTYIVHLFLCFIT